MPPPPKDNVINQSLQATCSEPHTIPQIQTPVRTSRGLLQSVDVKSESQKSQAHITDGLSTEGRVEPRLPNSMLKLQFNNPNFYITALAFFFFFFWSRSSCGKFSGFWEIKAQRVTTEIIQIVLYRYSFDDETCAMT